jgi:hypothetical protein
MVRIAQPAHDLDQPSEAAIVLAFFAGRGRRGRGFGTPAHRASISVIIYIM